MTRKTVRYVTAKDIIIPAGSVVSPAPNTVRRVGKDWASIHTAVTKDTTSEWLMPIDEALAAGLIRVAD